MKPLRILALAALVGGCDDPTVISHVDRLDGVEIDDLWTMQDSRGIPVEIHGAPFAHTTDRDLAAALRPPVTSAGELTFYAAAVGSWKGGHPWRVVLHFNPQGPPNAHADCRLEAEARTARLPETGFTVNASICRGAEWQAHGYLSVAEIEGGDLDAFGQHMRSLMLAIFGVEQDQ